MTDRQGREKSWQRADSEAREHQHAVNALRGEARRHVQATDRLETDLTDVRRARRDRQLSYWRQGWGADTETATEALRADGSEQISVKRLRGRAQEALREAIRAYLDVSVERDGRGEVVSITDRVDELDDDAPTPGQIDFDFLSRPLRARLEGWEERDARTAEIIDRERTSRRSVLRALQADVSERAATLEALQDMVEGVLVTRLRQIDAALDALDRRRAGFGAELQIESVRPQAPADLWRWRIVPRWRRSRSGGMVPYREVANGAQVKVFAVQLVLAALLAAQDSTGRVLVLDELGNSLGDVNRRDVLQALLSVAEGQGVTILGTCQDSVLADAADACGQIIWFTHSHADDAYNQPTRSWGFDDDGGRVALTAEWIRAGRPAV